MSINEYLAFLPLLIYGLALTDLFSEWKRLFDYKSVFIPYSVITIILTETALYNVYTYWDVVKELDHIQYGQYLVYLTRPFLFLLTVNAFTPENESITEEYFQQTRKTFFVLYALFVISYFTYGTYEGDPFTFYRVGIAVLVFYAGFTKKNWIVYFILLIWIVSVTHRAVMLTDIQA